MFKKKKITSVFQIVPELYILIDNTYVMITDRGIANEVATVELENGNTIKIKDTTKYEFCVLEDESDGVGTELSYRCKICNNPSIVFSSRNDAENHTKRCLFNHNAKSCVMCEHLKIIEYPPYPRFEKTYQSVETYHAFGAYKQPYCMKKEKNITEYELFDNHDECFKYSEEPPVLESTPEFDKYIELINSDDISSKKLTPEEIENLAKEE